MTTTSPPRYRSTLWTRDHLVPTLGLVLVVTLIAFEYLGVATTVPTMVADLHGGALYAWPVAAFTAANAVGTVAGGRICDRRGPFGPLLLGIALFAVGLVVDGIAPSMSVLLLGRVIQGIGAGNEIVAVYIVIAIVYPARDRPAASAMLSAAWVVPSLIGPPIAGLVTQVFGWRWVFLGLAPLVVLGIFLLVPVLRMLRTTEVERRPVRRGLVLAGVGAAVGVSAFTAAAQRLDWIAVPIGVAGLALLVVSGRRLVPPRTLLAGRGLPSVVLCGALLNGTFAAVETFLPLTLTAVHGYSPAAAGLPLTVGALGWSAASWWQGRNPDMSRTVLLSVAFGFVAAGLGIVSVVTWSWAPAWLGYVGWTVGGTGMGIGVASVSVLLLAQAPEHERGFHTSAMELSGTLGIVLLVGVGGVLVNAVGSAAHPSAAVFVFDVAMACLALFGAIVPARRSAGRLP